jgi:hypothetical protein
MHGHPPGAHAAGKPLRVLLGVELIMTRTGRVVCCLLVVGNGRAAHNDGGERNKDTNTQHRFQSGANPVSGSSSLLVTG